MKHVESFAIIAALGWLTGCASAPRVATVEPVSPVSPSPINSQGSLQVYSARERVPANPNAWQRPSDYNAEPLAETYNLAHTGYRLYSADGRELQYVRNANSSADPTPTLIMLPPGQYRIEAEAERPSGKAINLILPVVIQPGRTTVVNLSDQPQPQAPYTPTDVVRLPDGKIAGWVAVR